MEKRAHRPKLVLLAMVISIFSVTIYFYFLGARESKPVAPRTQTSIGSSLLGEKRPTSARATGRTGPKSAHVLSSKGQTFSVSSASKAGPRFVEGFIDPFNPRVGETQVIGMEVVDTVAVTSAMVMMKTDNVRQAYPLKLTQGTGSDGIWEGSWSVADTHDRIYSIALNAESARGASTVEVTLK